MIVFGPRAATSWSPARVGAGVMVTGAGEDALHVAEGGRVTQGGKVGNGNEECRRREVVRWSLCTVWEMREPA